MDTNQFKTDQELLIEGREAEKAIPKVSLRDQIPTKLAKKLKELGTAEQITNMWNMGNASRVEWLDTQASLLFEFEEFIEPIYQPAYAWSSTMHMPVAYTLCRTFHSRMLSALLGFDPPFTVNARKEANSDRAPLVQELMRYAYKDWANDNKGLEDALERWLWSWVTSGRGIIKYKWENKYSKFLDVIEVPKPGPVSYQIDPETGAEVAIPSVVMEEEEVEQVVNVFSGPQASLVNIEDLLIVGGEGDPDKADAVIHQQYLTAGELWSLVDQGIFDADEVEEVIKAGPDHTSSDTTGGIKQSRSEVNQQSETDVSYDLDRYRILECYLKKVIDKSGIPSDLVVWVAPTSRAQLRATYLYRISKSGKRPFAIIDFHRRTDTTNPVGLVELTYSLTKELDTIHNMRVDFGLLSTMPFGFYRASSSLAAESISFEPGTFLPLDNPQADVYIPNLGNRTSWGFQEEQALYGYIERMTSVSDMSLGLLGQQGAARTASGARIVNNENNANLDVYLKRMNRGFKKLLHGIFELMQDRIEPGFQFRITGDDGNNYWGAVKERAEIAGMYDFELEGSSNASNKQVQLDNAQQIYQLTANPLDIQLGIITPSERFEAVKNMLQTMGIKNWSKFARKPEGFSRLFTPEEVANRTLAGVDVKLGPEQDLDGIIQYIQYIIDNDEILGQFNEQQAINLAQKQQEALRMQQALEQMAAQQSNAQQMQMNAAQSQQQTGGGGSLPGAAGAGPTQ